VYLTGGIAEAFPRKDFLTITLPPETGRPQLWLAYSLCAIRFSGLQRGW
jgi:hypothetical protein